MPRRPDSLPAPARRTTLLTGGAMLALLAWLTACLTYPQPTLTLGGSNPILSFAAIATADTENVTLVDTLPPAVYEGWKQYSLICARCHGENAQGTSFGPSLLVALRPDGTVPTKAAFLQVLTAGRPAKGMPSAATVGLDSTYFEGLYAYLQGRSSGQYHAGRPVRGPK